MAPDLAPRKGHTIVQLPSVGDRIRSGSAARVLRVEDPNAYGNVRCIVVNERGELGWLVCYAGGGRSNVNYFPPEAADRVRGELGELGAPSAAEEDAR
jgi:hypothetical protein